jgi:squalene-associated FAD-dependent desaturase
VIVGGGLSGLAAAVALGARGIPIVLLEQKPALGGRAYSFTDATTGETIDNGQHILIAGYERTMKFLETIGTRDLLAVQSAPSILFHHPQRGFRRFTVPRFPSPFHLIAGVLRCNLFSLADRWRLLRAGLSIKGESDSTIKDLTVDQWLDNTGQSTECKRSFWESLAVSIMNEHITTAAALPFVRSLRTAFLGGWRNAALTIPRVGLSELYVEPARKFIALHGGKVFCGADVTEVLFNGTRVTGVRVRETGTVMCGAVILAVPNTKLARLLPPELLRHPTFLAMSDVATSPIVSIHLWFESDAMPDEFVGLISRRVQWVFNKRKLNKASGPGGHISAVISAAHEFVGLTNEELIQLTMEDLRSTYPSLPARATHAAVIREKRATFSCTPAVEQLRPSQKTPVPNLFLAGDWTDTGYPATIEGAITSAERCADLASNSIARGLSHSIMSQTDMVSF